MDKLPQDNKNGLESEQPNDFKAKLADKLKLEQSIKVEPPDSVDENAGESVTVAPAGERNEVQRVLD